MCGIFAALGVRKAAEHVVIGLHWNQHRAIDFAGIVSSDGQNFYRHSGPGVARQVFTRQILDRLHGSDALGHLRYPTVSDSKDQDNTQPIEGIYDNAPIAIAHNGNVTNTTELQKHLTGVKFTTSMDSEYILRLIEKYQTGNIEEDLARVLPMLRGSVSLVILLPNKLIALRDKSGNRPLSFGKSDSGGYFVSSETCAFTNVGAKLIGDVPAGSIVSMEKGKHSVTRLMGADEHRCTFEKVYFLSPNSKGFGQEVTEYRLTLGEALERHAPAIGADVVVAVPDSSTLIAIGYARSGRSGSYLPLIIRNHYVGRTFIAATQADRDIEVAQKFGFTAGLITGRKIVVVDDSIVRGTTMRNIVAVLRELEAKEIHVRIACPQIRHPCYTGINTPTYEELIASNRTREELLAVVGSDSLEFLSLEKVKEISPDQSKDCHACWDGKYWH